MNAVLDKDAGMVYGTCCTPGFEEVRAGVPMCTRFDLLFTHTTFKLSNRSFMILFASKTKT
jgi:hypothetical protein